MRRPGDDALYHTIITCHSAGAVLGRLPLLQGPASGCCWWLIRDLHAPPRAQPPKIEAGKLSGLFAALEQADASTTRKACLQTGMNDFVAKPIDLDNLFSPLAKWLPAQESS